MKYLAASVRAWDLLALLLFVFPFFTGGIWISRPGLFVELSDVGIPVILLCLLGFALQRQGVPVLDQSRVLKAASTLWARWRARLLHPGRPLILMTAAFGILWSISSCRKHWALHSNSFDLGIFTNALWNLTHGQGYVSAPKEGINLFADHQSPILWLLAPVFRILPHPETLLVVQAFVLAAGAPALYFLAAQYLGTASALPALLPFAYWLYVPIRNSNAFDFHPEVAILPLFLWAIVGLQSSSRRRRAWGALAFLLALAGKESAGPLAVGIGLAWILGAGPEATRSWTRRTGVVAVISGLLVFYVDLRIVPALISPGGEYAYQNLYADFGKGITELVLSPLLKPGLFWSRALGDSRLKFLFWTLAPLGFLPLLNGRAMVAALPGYLMLFLSQGDHRVNLVYHYAVEPAVALFWAVPGAALLLESRGVTVARSSLWLLIFVLAASGRSEVFRIRNEAPEPPARWIQTSLVPCLDPSLPLAATDSIVPHLSARHWAHNLTSLQLPHGTGSVACVVVNPELGNWPIGPAEVTDLVARLPGLGYREILHCGKTRVFQLSTSAKNCLRCAPGCPPG